MAEVDQVICYGCDKMFTPWTNEWFCSDKCHDDYPDGAWPKHKYGTFEECGGRAKAEAGNEPAEDSEQEAAVVVVRRRVQR